MDAPKVAVVVPVLNTLPWLDECLRSLLGQTMEDIEVIGVDNGSTDGSWERLQEYAAREPRIVALRHTRGRQGGARNAGLQRARGAYIGFVDSDDFVLPTMFERLYRAAIGSTADVAICNLSLCSCDGRALRDAIPPTDLRAGPPCTVNERPRLLRNLTICNRLFSRDLLDNGSIRFPEGHYHEDQPFVIEALLLARRIVTVPEALYCYRRSRPGSVNEARSQEALGVFEAMARVTCFVDRNRVAPRDRSLIDEVKALKYLQLYGHTDAGCRCAYHARMRKEFRTLQIPAKTRILSSSERREYQVARNYGRKVHDAYLGVRGFYGVLRRATGR